MSAQQGGNKAKKDEVFDLEQQFILRMPPGPAMALRNDIEQGAQNLKDKLQIELHADMRHGTVRYGGQIFNVKLVDLPCIIESLKTTDRKTFYKTADIGQMLVCKSDDESSDEDTSAKKPKDKDKKFQWNHGITPPLKNVRKRRFRKTLKKKHTDMPEIEKEVKRLFRMDNEAIDVKWEVVVEDEKSSQDHTSTQIMHGEVIHDVKPTASNMELFEQDLFGGISSSDEETEINPLDDSNAKPETSYNNDSLTGTDDMTGDLSTKLQELSKELEELKDRRMAQEMELSLIDDPVARSEMQSKLEKLLEQENEKQNEHEILASMVSQ